MRNSKDLRVVFQLKTDADSREALINKDKGVELQLDLTPRQNAPGKQAAERVAVKQEAAIIAPPVSKKARSQETGSVAKPVMVKTEKPKGRDIIVAIDAGHGGKDVGAQGGNGTQEKDVVFAIAKRLEGMVNSQSGMRAVMIRKGDYFVKLHERVKIAQAAKADLFVSIHADAFNDPSTHGASVYTLANKGASSAAARWLAESENAADGDGGDDRDDALNSVLIDLTKTAAMKASQNVGSKVLRSVNSVGHLHRNSVQKAGFVVLKSPDFPSILVETAYISNPEEEQRLNSRAYQDKMASAVFRGILSHFRQYAPANTLMAQLSKAGKVRRLADAEEFRLPADKKPVVIAKADTGANGFNKSNHVIQRGETLSGIAQQYGVSMHSLRMVNDMDEGNMKVGKLLLIPRNG